MAPFILFTSKTVGQVAIPTDSISSLIEDDDGATIVVTNKGDTTVTDESILSLTNRINMLIQEVG